MGWYSTSYISVPELLMQFIMDVGSEDVGCNQLKLNFRALTGLLVTPNRQSTSKKEGVDELVLLFFPFPLKIADLTPAPPSHLSLCLAAFALVLVAKICKVTLT